MFYVTKKEGVVFSPCNGSVIPLSEIPDEAFASGMLGIGFGVVPSDGKILSPVSGRVDSIAEGKHAYTLVTSEGLDVLVHIGVDTVELKGSAFSPRVAKGSIVQVGDLLAEVDLSMIRDRGLSDTVAVLVTETDRLESVEYEYGECTGGKDQPMHFLIRRK